MHTANEILRYVTAGAFIAAALGFAALFAMLLASALKGVMNSLHRRSLVKRGLICTFVLLVILAGGTKPEWYFEAGLRDNGSWASNNTAHAAWRLDGTLPIPASSALYIDWRPKSESNEWTQGVSTTVGAGICELTLPDATNYDYSVYYDWIPPQPVHTNGVWQYKTMRDRHDENILPLRARIEEYP